jgi:hypothetical protein
MVLGTLQDASQLIAKSGDDGVVRGVASVIGQEGEQNGFYRLLLGSKPSEKPFMTTNVGSFAFSFLQRFVVPGSCSFNISDIPVPIFARLDVEDKSKGLDVQPKDQTLTFSADLSGVEAAKKHVGGKGDGLFITYFSGQLLPISEPVSNVKWDGSKVTVDAFFPFTANVMQGLSVASLTTSANFSNAGAVPNTTLAAPALIQVNDKF